MERRAARYFPSASEIVASEEELADARDGYRIFFEVFIREDPANYLSFEAFAYKHFGAPRHPETHYVLARRDGAAVAMNWYLDAPLIYQGEVVAAVHGADTAALPAGRGAHFLGMFSKGERGQRRAGYRYRYGTPNENAMIFSERYGARVIGAFRSATALSSALDLSGVRELADVRVSTHATLPFTERDYERMNSVSTRIAAYRTEDYFAFRVDGLLESSFSYVVARRGEELLGYLILRWDLDRWVSIYDWDLFADAEAGERDILAALLAACREEVHSFAAGVVNADAGELELLESLGFRPVLGEDGTPDEQTFIVVPYDKDEGDTGFFDMARWRQRLIDRDYALNCLRQ